MQVLLFIFFFIFSDKERRGEGIMLKAEIELRKIKEAKEKGYVDKEGNILIVDDRGFPHNYKSTLWMKILSALDKFMYRR